MWSSALYVFVSVVSAILASEEAQSLVVTTESGPVRGYHHPKAKVYEFLDIPYATVPTGVNKFGPPLEVPKWDNTRKAVSSGIICPQSGLTRLIEFNMTMDENCLLASVFVPDTALLKLPVIVYVHGGGFQNGYGNALKPIDLVNEHNILAITFNYRLGIHGFLCLGTQDIPGNAGMKDQVALLRWVQRNIANFGGNPDDVTIAGYSAGSASVDLLMLSKSATGLFNKVIPESGANVGVWAIQSDPLESAKWYAKSLNFDNADDPNALEEFYKTLPYEKLTNYSIYDRTDSTFVFVPCVERPLLSTRKTDGKELFLDMSPVEILKNEKYKKVPLLYGFNNMEGLLEKKHFNDWKTKMNVKFSDFLPADLIFNSEEEKQKIAKLTKEFYFGDKPVSNDTILKYVDYFSDVMFTYPTLRSVKLQLEKGHDQIYLYEFSFVDDNTPKVPHTDVRGADHCAQSYAVFTGPSSDGFSNLTEDYKSLTSIMRKMWANFIKTGKPVPDSTDLPSWPPMSSAWSPYMSIGTELKLKEESLLLERTLFWENIYNQNYRKPITPSVSTSYKR